MGSILNDTTAHKRFYLTRHDGVDLELNWVATHDSWSLDFKDAFLYSNIEDVENRVSKEPDDYYYVNGSVNIGIADFGRMNLIRAGKTEIDLANFFNRE